MKVTVWIDGEVYAKSPQRGALRTTLWLRRVLLRCVQFHHESLFVKVEP